MNQEEKAISPWVGYEIEQFEFQEKEVTIIRPNHSREEKKWVWKTEFLEAFPYTEQAMLQEGYYIIYYKISDRYGDDASVSWMEEFYQYFTDELGFQKVGILVGFSRGGLYARRYATKYPSHVKAIYLDAPVVDLRSWPGGKGIGVGASMEWEECLQCYGLNEQELHLYEDSLKKELDLFLGHKIPLLLVYGDVDEVVPYEENGMLIELGYKKSGAVVKVVRKEGVGHHPHSLVSPEELVEFLIKI